MLRSLQIAHQATPYGHSRFVRKTVATGTTLAGCGALIFDEEPIGLERIHMAPRRPA